MAIPQDNDVYIVSDLHLGEGWDAGTMRYSRLEAFFYDADFRNFVRAIIDRQRRRRKPATLVLNGDVFDFLAMVRLPDELSLKSTGIRLTDVEQEFGLGNTQEKSVWKMDRIIVGHPKFFLALAELLGEGHHLVFIRGNHDAEMFWPAVRQRLMDALAQIVEDEDLGGPDMAPAIDRIEFRQWFYTEPGRFYIEHGNQYEASNAFKYVLNPTLPPEYHHNRHIMMDYPIGSLFIRYLYNKMKLLDPFTTHFVTLEQYIHITHHHNFMDLLRTGTLHFPFFFRAIREARVFEEQGMAPIKEEHTERMASLAKTSGLDDKVYELEKLMSPHVGTTKYNLLKEMLRPVARGALTFFGIALLSILCWMWIFSSIQHSAWVEHGVLAKASMLAILAVLTVVGLFLAFSFVNRALHRASDPVARRLMDRAERIAELLDVPNIAMGHTHTADLRPLKGGAGAFANSGTWIPHPGPWDSIKPKARQFTFLTIRGDRMKLHRWNDPARKWEPVTLLDEYHPTTLERLLAEGEQRPDHQGSAEEG